MARNIHITPEPVTLNGYQAVLKPSKFGYSLKALVGTELINELETERDDCLKWAESKLKNPKRATLKPTPWEEVAEGKYKIKFSWGEDKRPGVVDTEGTPITDKKTPLYGGSTVKLGFFQKPYILRDGVTYGSSLKLLGVQVVAVGEGAAVDTDSMDEAAVADMFGTTEGFKTSTPAAPVTAPVPDDDSEEDF